MGGVTGNFTTLVGQLKDLNPASGSGSWTFQRSKATLRRIGRSGLPPRHLAGPPQMADGFMIIAGTLSQTGDAYSCSDPTVSVWNGTDYIAGAIVQGHIATPNTTGTPTLAVGGHPALPIINSEFVPLFITCNAGVGNGTIAATGSSYSGTTVTLNLTAGLTGAKAVGMATVSLWPAASLAPGPISPR